MAPADFNVLLLCLSWCESPRDLVGVPEAPVKESGLRVILEIWLLGFGLLREIPRGISWGSRARPIL